MSQSITPIKRLLMNALKTTTYVLFYLFVACIQSTHPLHIKDVKNESWAHIKIVHCSYDQGQETIHKTIDIDAQKTKEINFILPENIQPLTNLYEAEHYLKISIGPKVFFCATGKRTYADDKDLFSYGFWSQKAPSLNASQPTGIHVLGGKHYTLRCNAPISQETRINLSSNPTFKLERNYEEIEYYNLPCALFHKDIPIEPLNTPITLIIDFKGNIL